MREERKKGKADISPFNIDGQPDIISLATKETQSDIATYKEVLRGRFEEASTTKEHEDILSLRSRIYELEVKEKELLHAEKVAIEQLRTSKQRENLHLWQLIAGSAISIMIGLYLLKAIPVVGLLFLTLVIAKLLGYSIGDVNFLLGNLRGFLGGTEDPPKNHRINSEEEDGNAGK